MFVLATICDNVRLLPHTFNQPLQQSLQNSLNRKLANKVLLNVGLCVCFYDFESIGKSFVLPGDGAGHTKVTCRIVVFRPFIDEILLGSIRSCDPRGVHISLGFFDDIFVPAEKLPMPSKFLETEQVWCWEYEADDKTHQLFMDVGKPVRFRVSEERFIDTHPSLIKSDQAHIQADAVEDGADKKIPYMITACMSEPGLGCLDWWT